MESDTATVIIEDEIKDLEHITEASNPLPANPPKPETTETSTPHIVPFGKFHRIRGAPPETFRNVKYDAPEEMGGDRKCFDSPIRK